MKTFVLEGNFPSYNIETISPLENRGDVAENFLPCPLLNVPDTVRTTRNRPFFIPDSMGECRAQLHPAVRIGRLGRHIAPQFAHRYYDALTLCVSFSDGALLQRLRAAGLPWDLARAHDGSVCVGEMLVREAERCEMQTSTMRLLVDGEEMVAASCDQLLCDVNRLIASISCYYKLCDGDLILCGTPSEGIRVGVGAHFEAYLDDRKLLDFYTK